MLKTFWGEKSEFNINERNSIATPTPWYTADWIVALSVAGLVVLYFVLFTNWLSVYDYDPDEGYNLIKAKLLSQGYRLFDDIWTDQPPVYTYLLWAVFELFGFSTTVGRGVSLVFSGIIVFVLYDTLRYYSGHLAAWAGVLFLVGSFKYAKLSIAVMIGLPALSLSLLAFWFLVQWEKKQQHVFLALSGAVLAVSVCTKMITLPLLPAFGLCIVFTDGFKKKGDLKKLVTHLSIFSVALVSSGIICMLPALISDNPIALISPHLKAASTAAETNRFASVWRNQRLMFFVKDAEVYLLAAVGLVFAIILKRKPFIAFFALWAVGYWTLLLIHRPIWHHHVLFVSVPSAALAGFAFNELADVVKKAVARPNWVQWGSIGLLLALVLGGVCIKKDRLRRLHHPKPYRNSEIDHEIHTVIANNMGHQRNMVTSRQIFAFNTDARIPPSLSVTSKKRIWSGELSAEQILKEINNINAEQVFICRRWPKPMRDKLKKELTSNYTLIFDDINHGQTQLYLRNDLVKKQNENTTH